MKIRPAKPDETKVLTELVMVSKQANGYSDAFMALCRDDLRVTPERLRDGNFWVAEVPEGLCGCVCLSVDDDGAGGEVSSFFVHPDFQGKGVGKRLWHEIVALAKDHGLTVLHLESDPAAQSFYDKLGFTTIRETPSGSIAGRMLPYMELQLDAH